MAAGRSLGMSTHSSTMVTFLRSMGSTLNTSTAIPTPLTELNLYDCKLSDDVLIALSEQFRQQSFPFLKILDLGLHQNLSADCISNVFVPAVKHSFELEDLTMIVDDFQSRRQLRFVCDVNRAGRRYIQRNDGPDMYFRHGREDEDYVKMTKATTKTKSYPIALWPLILVRNTSPRHGRDNNDEMNRDRNRHIISEMSLPDTIFSNTQKDARDDDPTYRENYDGDYDDDNDDDDEEENNNYENENENENDDKNTFIETDNVRRASIIYYLLVQKALVECWCG